MKTAELRALTPVTFRMVARAAAQEEIDTGLRELPAGDAQAAMRLLEAYALEGASAEWINGGVAKEIPEGLREPFLYELDRAARAYAVELLTAP